MTEYKRDFGSFHASNVQETISLSEDQYIAPKFLIDVPSFTDIEKDFKFGKICRKKHFYLEDDCTFLNHGAFGGVLKEAMETAQKWQIYTERQPLRFFDRELIPHLVHISRRLAKFVGCDPTDLVLVTNATTAINTVVKGIKLQEGDTVYMLNLTYGAVKKLLRWQCQQTGAKLQEENITLPLISKEQIVDLVRKSLKEGTKLAVFDHIPSNTPFILPIDEIITICKEKGVPVLIDGAHALGAIHLDLRSLDPDYYVSNAHKWFCAPKGCAFMYVKKELQSQTRPVVISHGFGSGFNSEFIWAGLHDYSPFLALHTVIDFWEAVGVSKIRDYMHNLFLKSCDILIQKWGTSLAAPANMFGCLGLVELPPDVYKKTGVEYSDAESLQNLLYHQFNIEVPVKCVDGVLYVRISCHIYNETSEYEKLGDAILTIMKERNCNKRQKTS